MDHYYLIGFVAAKRFATIDVRYPHPIAGPADVAAVQADLRAHLGSPDLLVLSFSRFDQSGGSQ